MPPNLSLIRGKKCTFRKAIFPGMYVQGDGVFDEIPPVINRFGGKGLIVASPSAMEGPLARLRDQLPQGTTQVRFNGQCSDTELARLASILSKHGPSVVAGVGGGKAIDAAKVLADRAGLPVITLPTIASTEAPCSACAILHNEQGVAQQVHCLRRNPDAVLVDTGIIARAPARYLVSGMGNALATWFEARSCERTASPNECGGFRTFSSIALARLCYDTLMEYGTPAKQACEQRVVTPALERVIEANILLSGLGFECSGLAAAHSIHNGMAAYPATLPYHHGEKVAFGVLAGLHLTDATPDEMASVYGFCVSVGLPVTFAQVGLGDATRDDLLKVAERACAPNEGIHHEAGEITPARVLAALLAADSMGRTRRNNA